MNNLHRTPAEISAISAGVDLLECEGMDVKTLSAMLGHVSASTTLDIYTHATSDMQYATARKIDCGISKAELAELKRQKAGRH